MLECGQRARVIQCFFVLHFMLLIRYNETMKAMHEMRDDKHFKVLLDTVYIFQLVSIFLDFLKKVFRSIMAALQHPVYGFEHNWDNICFLWE